MRHVRCIRSSGARAVRCSKGDRCCCCRPSVFEAVRANQGDLYQLPCRGSHEFFPQVKVGCRCRPPTPLPPTLPRTFLSLPPSTHLLPPPPTTTTTKDRPLNALRKSSHGALRENESAGTTSVQENTWFSTTTVECVRGSAQGQSTMTCFARSRHTRTGYVCLAILRHRRPRQI